MNPITCPESELTVREIEVLADLRANVENEYVPLGNCKLYGTRGWNGVLSSLTKKGYYRPEYGDFAGAFGTVRAVGDVTAELPCPAGPQTRESLQALGWVCTSITQTYTTWTQNGQKLLMTDSGICTICRY